MLALLNHREARHKLAENFIAARLRRGLTQADLAKRSGVSLGSVRRFEQSAQISLASLMKLAMVLDLLEPLVKASEPKSDFRSIEDVINANKEDSKKTSVRKRARR